MRSLFTGRVVKHGAQGAGGTSGLGDPQNVTDTDPEQPAVTLKLEQTLHVALAGGSGCLYS